MDEIRIKELELFANHGVLPEETVLGQKFKVNATFYTDISKAAAEDDIHLAINYAQASQKITEYLQNHTFKLIETAADSLAKELLLIPGVKGVDVELLKPWAPIGLPVESVSVKTSRRWHRSFLSIGSNMGDKKGYLDFALKALKENPMIRMISVADYIQTEPYGNTEQDCFLNSAVELETGFNETELLKLMQQIEQEAGRERIVHWGPRTLDLDMLFFDDLVIGTKDLILPHPDLENRSFVLEPMTQIAPYLRHPVLGKTILQLNKELNDKEL